MLYLNYTTISMRMGGKKHGSQEPMKEREAVGQEIVETLQEENAFILLAPHLQYLLSSLYIALVQQIKSVTDFILSLPDISVKRDYG